MFNQTGKCPYCKKYIDISLKQCPKCNASLMNTGFEEQYENKTENLLNDTIDSLIGIILKTFGIVIVIPVVAFVVALLFPFILPLCLIFGVPFTLIAFSHKILPKHLSDSSFIHNTIFLISGLSFIFGIMWFFILKFTRGFVALDYMQSVIDFFVAYIFSLIVYIPIALLIVFVILLTYTFLASKFLTKSQ